MSGGIAPLILNSATRRKGVVRIMIRQFFFFYLCRFGYIPCFTNSYTTGYLQRLKHRLKLMYHIAFEVIVNNLISTLFRSCLDDGFTSAKSSRVRCWAPQPIGWFGEITSPSVGNRTNDPLAA